MLMAGFGKCPSSHICSERVVAFAAHSHISKKPMQFIGKKIKFDLPVISDVESNSMIVKCFNHFSGGVEHS
jgi:hypothetical protein